MYSKIIRLALAKGTKKRIMLGRLTQCVGPQPLESSKMILEVQSKLK